VLPDLTNQRRLEAQALDAFAWRHGLARDRADAVLPLRGVVAGVHLSISKVDRGASRERWAATQFLATAPHAIPGGLVAYKPNFRWRFSGPRKIQDSVGVSGLIGFVHHDPVGDAELDRKLVIYADDVPLARALLTTPAVKTSILAALGRAGHIRIHESRVALEVSERRRGVVALLASAEEVEALALAATDVVRALCTAAAAWGRRA
jgi:hypothetical protein